MEKSDISVGNHSVLAKGNLPEGLNGLLANRLLNEYKLSSAVFSPSRGEEGVLVGSLRLPDGGNLMPLLNEVESYAIRCGGHAQAAGITIWEKDYDRFRKDFDSYCMRNPAVEAEEAIDISVSDLTEENYQMLRCFAPFGQGHREPRFILRDIPVSRLRFIVGGRYLLTLVSPGVKIKSFRCGVHDFDGLSTVDMKARWTLNEYKGKTSIEVIVDKL